MRAPQFRSCFDTGHVGHNGHDYHDVPDVHDGGCGRSRDISQSRILGGQEAGYGQFPWSAMIHITSDQFGLDKSCAGTLVHDRSVSLCMCSIVNNYQWFIECHPNSYKIKAVKL